MTASPVTDTPDGFAQRAGAADDRRLSWFRRDRFGLFVHWGLYSLLGGTWHGQHTPNDGEWIMHDLQIPAADYRAVADAFAPAHFDADELVQLAVAAGQKYVVLTAKHHDGFCLWRTSQTDFSIVAATPFGRDVVAEVADACRRHDLRFGLYYSQTQDWTHPDASGNDWDYDPAAKDFDAYLRNYVHPQLTELLTGYGPIALIWFDTPQHMSAQQSRDLVEHVHRLQPDCLVNGRVGNGLGDYGQTRDNGMAARPDGDWETPVTGNETWGFVADDEDWKSAQTLVHTLAQVASKGGNLLLNVGPDGDGRVPAAQVQRLRAVGDWLITHGVAIYGTRPGRFQELPWGWCTETDDRMYLHIAQWPTDGVLHLPRVPGARSARLLGAEPTSVSVTGHDATTTLHLPAQPPRDIMAVVALELNTDLDVDHER